MIIYLRKTVHLKRGYSNFTGLEITRRLKLNPFHQEAN